jgi:hypothetical protein
VVAVQGVGSVIAIAEPEAFLYSDHFFFVFNCRAGRLLEDYNEGLLGFNVAWEDQAKLASQALKKETDKGLSECVPGST